MAIGCAPPADTTNGACGATNNCIHAAPARHLNADTQAQYARNIGGVANAMKMFALALAALALISPAFAAEVHIAPSEGVVLTRANGRGYNDLVVHGVAIASAPTETIRVRELRVELLEAGIVRETRVINGGELAAATQTLASAGFREAIDSQVLDTRGLEGVFARPITLAQSDELPPSTALVASALYFAVAFEPDQVRATVTYTQGRRTRTAAAIVTVEAYVSPIVHIAPVAGIWTQQAVPTLQSHHRLNPATEFATDFFRTNEAGEIYGGDPLQAENAFGYGAPVMATAEGEVVAVVADEVQDRAAMLRRLGESSAAARERIGRYVQARMARDFRRAAAGNLVVIRHEQDGVVEYSSYAHLRAGSVRVAVGQRVSQGQVLGEVGDTGDSAAVHLHYQLNSGPDPFTSRSLPVRFQNLRPAGGNSELGRIVVIG